MELMQKSTDQSPSTNFQFNGTQEDLCTTLAWFELVALESDEQNGDEWLYLCDDISEGELYGDWFLWQDQEVTGNWEAYDPLDNTRYTASDLSTLKANIDQIEAIRNTFAHGLLRKIA